MITILGLLFGAILLGGVVVLMMQSGKKNRARAGQSSNAEATEQRQMSNPRGDVRSGGLD